MVPLPGDRIAVVIGDSVGHGVTAAAAMGQLRVAAHTLAGREFPPGELLERLDRIAQGLDAAQFATCLCLVYDPATRRCEVAGAGHPPPLPALRDGTVQQLGVPAGPPFGVSDEAHPPRCAQVSAEIPPGAVLALTPTASWRAANAAWARASRVWRPRSPPHGRAGWRTPPTASWPCSKTSRARTTSPCC
ncbi:MAG TPA: PP2C family protein-serine/threonine phosphatase [Spirillospora sp.]